jgi:5-methylcytosine-specific restriction endonuclease McrA
MNRVRTKTPRLRLAPDAYEQLRQGMLERDTWRCQNCGSMQNLEVHHKTRRSHQGDHEEANLITLCNPATPVNTGEANEYRDRPMERNQ